MKQKRHVFFSPTQTAHLGETQLGQSCRTGDTCYVIPQTVSHPLNRSHAVRQKHLLCPPSKCTYDHRNYTLTAIITRKTEETNSKTSTGGNEHELPVMCTSTHSYQLMSNVAQDNGFLIKHESYTMI